VASRSLHIVVVVVLFVADTGHEVWLSLSAQVPLYGLSNTILASCAINLKLLQGA